ncbi:hypothetical protein [Methylobacterium nodulans]|uniref:Uncharacterized protein n=1 Tax=Methylobacterium nodulans (strain LMG 21967 / CNCM I-2342 / ORS 2060) TaxID=460265 RepID=B8IJS7_METNO|nr:hypothetical protein [Methylobacterium nodulans]ACL58125.1 conserved hypothetical protein [Methylobacterium nodulans ORS 2060]
MRVTSLALIPLTIAFLGAPAYAQETFKAWGHEFLVPGRAAPVSATAAPRRFDTLTTGGIGSPRSFTSSERAEPKIPAPASQEKRTLNVWGARIDVPSR